MYRTLLGVGLFVLFFTIGSGEAFALRIAAPESVSVNGKTYYVVSSGYGTGNYVCEIMGKKCVGYTAFNTNVCKNVHPDAAIKSDMNGSKAGFYCDGPPQGGVCANEKNTCHICTNCGVNATCETQIGDLYREMYVQCSGGEAMGDRDPARSGATAGLQNPLSEPSKLTGVWKNFWDIPGRWWGAMRSSVQRSFDSYRSVLGRLNVMTKKYGKIKVQGPKGDVEVDAPVDSLICEYYQKNKKLVTCGALAAADQFCVQAFDSRFAKAELCQDDGLIICSKPCTTNPQELKPQRCAFDGDRPRGSQAAPIDLCTETKTIKVDVNELGKKKAGQQCAHGGECGTGYCLGQTSDNGMKYFCSCKQSTLDYTCGK